MAGELSITATSVAKSTSAKTGSGTAGATITAGQALYLDATTNTLKLAQCDGTAAEAACVGIALHAATSGQPITYQKSGDITIGATVAVGTCYFVATTAGGICPHASLASTDKAFLVGVGKSTTVIALTMKNTGAAVA